MIQYEFSDEFSESSRHEPTIYTEVDMIIHFRIQDVEELWGSIDLATLLQSELRGVSTTLLTI